MDLNMLVKEPAQETATTTPGAPWKTLKGKCRTVTISRYKSGGRFIFQMPTGAKPPNKTRFTTSNPESALKAAQTLADLPTEQGATLVDLGYELGVKVAVAVEKLESVLSPLEMSIHAGLDEYRALKARTGKLALGELFDGLLTGGSSPVNTATFAERARDVSVAIAKLTPILDPLKISVGSAIEEYAAVKAKVGAQDLRELLKALSSKPWVEKCKTALSKVVEEFLAAKKNHANASYEYHKTLYYGLAALVRQVEAESGIGASIGSVTTDQLKGFVFNPNRAARGNSTYRTNVRTFFHWAQLNQYLDYGEPTAADRLERIRIATPAPKVLKVSEAKAILSALEDPWSLIYVALSLFTGIRHDELQRATFDIIRRHRVVDIPPEISKTKKRRVIPIQECLDAWLAPFYGRHGLVIPTTNIQLKVRTFLENCDAAGVPCRWGRNWMRQSFASYRLAQTGEVIQTSQEDGHYAYVLERIYLDRSSKEDALEFFALTPEACGKPDWKRRVKAFLADVPEVHARTKYQSRPWKPIGGKVGEQPATTEVQAAIATA